MSTIQEKASKWDSLIKWIKDTKDEEDTDVWEKLAELCISASGEQEEIMTIDLPTDSEDEVCGGGCNKEICNDCPVDNTSNRYFKCSDCNKWEIEDEDDYKEGYMSTICWGCKFGTGDPTQVYKELAGI